MISDRQLAYLCSTAIVIAALALAHDGYLALAAVAGMLGIDKILQVRESKKEG